MRIAHLHFVQVWLTVPFSIQNQHKLHEDFIERNTYLREQHNYVACAVLKLLIGWEIDQEDKQGPGLMTFQLPLRTRLGFKILHPPAFRICHAQEWPGGCRGSPCPAPCCWPWPCTGLWGESPEQDNANSDTSLVFSVCGTGTSQASSGVFNSSGRTFLPLIWPVTSKMHLNLYYLPVSCCKEFPSLKKIPKKQNPTILCKEVSPVFFLSILPFWFHMMPLISKREKKEL